MHVKIVPNGELKLPVLQDLHYYGLDYVVVPINDGFTIKEVMAI